MSAAALSPVVAYIRKVAGPLPPGDAELLGRFARHGDESAFAALVERHGPMVLAVCRRLLHREHDAEDAFQATFLLLVRKAGTLTRPAALGPWLYGVAYRTALKARAQAARRRTQAVHEADRVADDPSDAVVWRDLRPLLDAAIDGLPAKYRAPFVLCYLEGRSNAEAAEELGCPRGTVATRLSRARDRLRQQLSRRGVALSAGVLALLPCRRAVAAPLVQATVAAAAGRASAASVEICALTKGVVHAMFQNRMRLAVAGLMVAVVGVGSCLLAGRGQAGPPAPAGVETPPPPRSVEKLDKKRSGKVHEARPVAVTIPAFGPLPVALDFGFPIAQGPHEEIASPSFQLARARWQKKLQLVVTVPVTSYRLRRARQKIEGEDKERVIEFYEPVTTYRRQHVTVEGVEALGADGQKVSVRKLKRLLEKERLVVVCTQRPAAAQCRDIFKDSTLILVVSSLPTWPVGSVAPPPTAPAPTVIDPLPPQPPPVRR